MTDPHQRHWRSGAHLMVPIFLLFLYMYISWTIVVVCLQLFMGKHGDKYVCPIYSCCADTSVWSDMLTISIKLSPNRAKQKSNLCQHFCVGFGTNTVSSLWLAAGWLNPVTSKAYWKCKNPASQPQSLALILNLLPVPSEKNKRDLSKWN